MACRAYKPYQKIHISVINKINMKKRGASDKTNNDLLVLLPTHIENKINGIAIKMPEREYLYDKGNQPLTSKGMICSLA